MHFEHSDRMWQTFPELVPGALFVSGITIDADVSAQVARYSAIAASRLDGTSEGALPEIQAWRRTFSKMGLKPTQYRCASESLLRRFRKEGSLPEMHPLVSLCNAISIAFAIPIAVFDVSKVAGSIEVRHAQGNESYQTFSGEVEHPEPDEVIFADSTGNAHARRWTNRQSGLSGVSDSTSAVLIVSEAMHDTASTDVATLTTTVTEQIEATWSLPARSALLTASSTRFEFEP